jgi:hydroxymethylbilane synthase
MIIPLRIGTRGSPLALWQARHVAEQLRPLAGPRPVELVEIETAGDRVRDLALSQIGGDGVFTKEIQRALLDGTVDVAVHSLKDLPTTHVEGLTLAAVPPRGPAGDAFVSRRHRRFDELPPGAGKENTSHKEIIYP